MAHRLPLLAPARSLTCPTVTHPQARPMANSSSGDPSRALAKLGILAGPRIGEEIAIPSPVVHIGSGSQNDVVIPDDSVSKAHAQLEFVDGSWRITDLESTNGTFVEGVRLAPHVPTPLFYGHSVRFGGVRMQFREENAADPEAARASYVPPAETPRLAERAGGFRLPVWLFALILLVLGIIVFFVVGGADRFLALEAAPGTPVLAAHFGLAPGGP